MASLILFCLCLLRFFGMSLCGLCSIVLCLDLLWCVDLQMEQEDKWIPSVAPLVKGHPSSLSFVQGHLRGKEWKAQRAQSQKRAVTLKNPLYICHCQDFSAKVVLLLTQSRNNMKAHFSHSAQDMTYMASFSVCGFLFSDKALAWFPVIPSVAISKVNGKTRKCANNQRKMVN